MHESAVMLIDDEELLSEPEEEPEEAAEFQTADVVMILHGKHRGEQAVVIDEAYSHSTVRVRLKKQARGDATATRLVDYKPEHLRLLEGPVA